MRKEEKKASVEELTKAFEAASVVLMSDFSGMDVETATEIRRRFREASVEFRVVKNTLARRAAEKAGMGELAEHLTGPNALVLADTDPAPAAKILAEFEKKSDTPKIRTGWIDATIMSAAEVRRIADLPTREELLAQVLAGFQAPVAGLARLLNELTRTLVSTLDEVAKKKAGSDAAEAV